MNTAALVLAGGGIIALLFLFLAFRVFSRKRLIDDTPTSKAQGVFIGLVELKGTAESDAPLTGYLSGAFCIYYKWHVDERWSRLVTETYTDSKGRVMTRTRRETGWTTVASGEENPAFYLKDDSGIIRIVPQGAAISGKETFDKNCSEADPLYFEKGPASAIVNSDHVRRFVENAIPLHAPLYIMGQASERQDIVAAEIAKDKKAPLYIISMKTEKQISASYNFQYFLWLCLGLLVATGTGIGWSLLQPANTIEWQIPVYGAAAFVVAGGLGWLWALFNSLVRLRQMTQQGWSQVDVQLKRRHDLIPNLVQTIEGYKSHEQAAQLAVTQLRGQLEATPPGAPGADYNGLTPLLRAVVEKYPELKASEMFLRLQNFLTETEQRIALARDYYNNIATFYNTRLQIFPDGAVASITGFRQRRMLEAYDFERAPVQVKLLE